MSLYSLVVGFVIGTALSLIVRSLRRVLPPQRALHRCPSCGAHYVGCGVIERD